MNPLKGWHHNGLPALVLDILETWCGEWFTAHNIHLEVVRLRPGTHFASTQRAIYRLVDRQLVELEPHRAGRYPKPARFKVETRSYWTEEAV